MFIDLVIKFIILLKIINEMGCWYIILLLVVSTPVYIIAIDNVVLVINMIILIIHIYLLPSIYQRSPRLFWPWDCDEDCCGQINGSSGTPELYCSNCYFHCLGNNIHCVTENRSQNGVILVDYSVWDCVYHCLYNCVDVVLITNTIILITIHLFATINISKITLLGLTLRSR